MSTYADTLQRRHYRGFNDWRTTPANDPRNPVRVEGPRCVKCGCLMNGGNGTDTCGPCSFGHVEIPEWALALVECDSANTTFDTLGAALVSRPPRERKADPREEWSRRVILEEDREYMAELHRNGLNVMQIGERVGCHYTTVKYHLRQMGYGRDHTPSPETVARVLDMAPTHTRTQTAQALGLTIRRVNLIYQEHGLELVRGKSPRPAWSGKRGEAA